MNLEPDATSSAARTPPAAAPPDREAAHPLYRYTMHLGLPLIVSLLIHAGIVGFLAYKTFNVFVRTPADIGEWSGAVVDADKLDNALRWDDVASLSAASAAPDAASDLGALTRDPSLSELSASDFATPSAAAAGETGTLGLNRGSLSLLGTGSGSGAAGTGGLGSGSGGGERVRQAEIWNLSIQANKVVYVVDYSGSIIVAVDDLRRELKRSIGRLVPGQAFNVILFYSSGGGQGEELKTESFKPQLQPADQETRLAFFRWIDRKAPMGVTEPLDAIRRALAFEPDAVFFFSDGYFDDAVVGEITRANGAVQARIYGVVFDEILLQDQSGLPRETEGTRRMKRIAEANRGQVKIVTRKDLTR